MLGYTQRNAHMLGYTQRNAHMLGYTQRNAVVDIFNYIWETGTMLAAGNIALSLQDKMYMIV